MIDADLLWHEVSLQLIGGAASAVGHALVPPLHAEFGVISDIDDTIVETGGIPPGPMFLQDFGLDRDTLLHDPHEVHKLREIQSILDYYPTLPFVLIGDSGQHDPEIYLQVIQANPGRIRAAFIRDVTPATRDAAVERIAGEALAAGSPMIYVPDSAEAQQHAQKLGLIR